MFLSDSGSHKPSGPGMGFVGSLAIFSGVVVVLKVIPGIYEFGRGLFNGTD